MHGGYWRSDKNIPHLKPIDCIRNQISLIWGEKCCSPSGILRIARKRASADKIFTVKTARRRLLKRAPHSLYSLPQRPRRAVDRGDRCPALAIHGDYDPRPSAGVRGPLQAARPSAEFVEIERCGSEPPCPCAACGLQGGSGTPAGHAG